MVYASVHGEKSMRTDKAIYFELLSKGVLTNATISKVTDHIQKNGLKISPIPNELFKQNDHGGKITEHLTRLNLSLIDGNSSWEGLMDGFPGSREDLSTKTVGTPYLRIILYPILDLHHRLQAHTGKKLPCIYFIGERFSEVFLRKFDLLKEVVPNIIVLTHDLFENSKSSSLLPVTGKSQKMESWTQMKLCQIMNSREGLLLPIKTKSIRIKYLSSEVPCNEGTENPERPDILGYEESDHGLIAFELKGSTAGRVELENLFLQGIEHRNWLEKNKMAVKLFYDRGPKGKRINTRKRVRLLLGFYGDRVPDIFEELRYQAKRRDPYTEIDFIRLTNINDEVVTSSYD